MWQRLTKPYYLNASFAFHFKQALLFSSFVFLFLFVFKPFSIEHAGHDLWRICLGFGAVTFASMFLVNICVPLFFRDFFEEEKWTVGKEVFYTLINLFTIGIFNFVFFILFFKIGFSWQALFWVQFITLSVGVFPVTFSIFFKEKMNRLKYHQGAQMITENIHHTIPELHSPIKLSSKNQHENLEMDIQNLLFLKSAYNYIEVYFLDKTLQKKLIRNTLKEIESETEKTGNFFRCHKSYIVNLDKVTRLSGNAQGYKLHFNETMETVPVSRQFNASIKERLTVGQ